MMVEARAELGIVVCVVHFNHGLRGRAADADEAFVRKLAERHGLEFFVGREKVAAKAKREKANLEDAGRRARYSYFERLVKEGHVSRVAVAHTADDQAETVLAHILRGTGLAGLGGIHPTNGCVFRPLLNVRRAELRACLRAAKQNWREDKTNRDVTRTRARIRSRLLPLLEREFNGGVVEHLCQLAELAREDNALLDALAEKRLREICAERGDGIAVPVRELVFRREDLAGAEELVLAGTAFPGPGGALARRMVRELVARVKEEPRELGAKHIETVLALAAQGHSGQILQLPGRVEVRREREALVFCGAKTRVAEAASKGYEVAIHLPKAGEVLRVDVRSRILLLRVIDWPVEGRETKGLEVFLDAERLREPLVLRNWRPGDAMRPAKHQKRRTLARLLNELGASRWEKESWPVLASAGNVAWAAGLPAAEEFAARAGSRRAMVISEERKA